MAVRGNRREVVSEVNYRPFSKAIWFVVLPLFHLAFADPVLRDFIVGGLYGQLSQAAANYLVSLVEASWGPLEQSASSAGNTG